MPWKNLLNLQCNCPGLQRFRVLVTVGFVVACIKVLAESLLHLPVPEQQILKAQSLTRGPATRRRSVEQGLRG